MEVVQREEASDNVRCKTGGQDVSARQPIIPSKTLVFLAYHLKGIRFSMLGFQDQEWMENVPLFAAKGHINELFSRQ